MNILEGLTTVAECRISVHRQDGSGNPGHVEACFRPQEVPEQWSCPNSTCSGKGPGSGFAAAIYLGGLLREMVNEGKTHGEGFWRCPAREKGNGPSCGEVLLYYIDITFKPSA